MKKLNVIFMGTPDFAVPCLKMLYEKHTVLGVITQPDRPKGRGQKLMASPVKQFAEEKNLNVYQPLKIKEPSFQAFLRSLQPDVIVVVAFGQILPKEILEIPPLGCINVHASLLPHYRGAAPIHWSVIQGETKTGITTMFMDEGLDTGDMILKKEIAIGLEDTTGEIHDRLMQLGAEVLNETLFLLQQNTVPREKQDAALATYAPLLTKAVEKIDWSQPAQKIHNQIRGLCPWPGTYCFHNEKILKIWKARIVEGVANHTIPGKVVQITVDGFYVSTGQGILEIVELQPANKKRMSARAYVNGHGIHVNDDLI